MVFAVSFTSKALDAAEMYTTANSSGLLPQPTADPLTEKVVSLRSQQGKVWLCIAKALLKTLENTAI